MKNVIAFAISFAFASVAFAGGPSSSAGYSKMDSLSSVSAVPHSFTTSPASDDSVQRSVAMGSSAGGASVSRSGDSVSISHGAQSSRNSASASKSSSTFDSSNVRSVSQHSVNSQQGATKTRCIIKKSGDVEEKVCQYSTISMAEADSYFVKAAEGSKSTVR